MECLVCGPIREDELPTCPAVACWVYSGVCSTELETQKVMVTKEEQSTKLLKKEAGEKGRGGAG